MKKVLLFVAVVTVTTFASCKKDRTCTCRTTESSGNIRTEATVYFNSRKKDAREACLGHQTTISNSTGSTTAVKGDETQCELK